MEQFLIRGGNKLFGELFVSASKNAILPILAASVMSDGKVTLGRVPKFSDVDIMLNILTSLGATIMHDQDSVIIDPTTIVHTNVPEHLAIAMRASFFCLGPLLGKFRSAQISYPGGCKIGTRPVDIHLMGLTKLGATITEDGNRFICLGQHLKGANISFGFPSVGATENVMMAAVMAKGTTTIHNAAREPEIDDLANFLNAMGAQISGAGTSEIVIEGVKRLHGTEYTPIPDRIMAGTFVIAAAAVGGKVLVNNVVPKHIASLIAKLNKCGCQTTIKNDTILIQSDKRLKSIPRIATKPYPGFPTDLQSPIMALQCLSDGKSTITENLFETRFGAVEELRKMGANIEQQKNKAMITGVKQLHGAKLKATDLRAGAALVIAALKAEGETIICDVANIDRGYESLEQQFALLGADIVRN